MSDQSPNTEPPGWPHCGVGASPETDPVGCLGIHVSGHTACLAHLADTDRDAYLSSLTPGADIDHRGTTFSKPLLRALFTALHDPTTRQPRFGKATFSAAVFQGDAQFSSATFEGAAWFDSAIFYNDALFNGVRFLDSVDFKSTTFRKYTVFNSATFKKGASFESATIHDGSFNSATFQSEARFMSTTFEEVVSFDSAIFQLDSRFHSVNFQKGARFDMARFERDAWFKKANFGHTSNFGPLMCAETVRLDEALFSSPVIISIAAPRVHLSRTRWTHVAELRLRYATMDLDHAIFEYPFTITAEPNPFTLPYPRIAQLNESPLSAESDASVRITSLDKADAAHLVLADVDLSECLFSGTIHLDQLRLEGVCSFAKVPSHIHWQRWLPMRFTPRRTLVEEHHWRARRPGATQVWTPRVNRSARSGPAQLAPMYRSFRKAAEDTKDDPGAADFYYGEMEMRRHSKGWKSGERWLLQLYWLLSGYGLRASRALGWLVAAMTLTVLATMQWGLPQDSPKQEVVREKVHGEWKTYIDKEDPKNPTKERFSTKRFDKALSVTLNSVVFRSSGQDLTTAGGYIEMASRFSEPVLLGLAALAIRGRVKR